MPELLGGPFRCGMRRHAEVQYAATVMRQDQKDKEQTEGCSRDNEEVSGNQLVGVITQKRSSKFVKVVCVDEPDT